ncbi:hypothetical protein AGMMS49991_04140 [Spirochaetia bacterium]|nr:hypothetical protein AGMMS49991_04140 [Spirochaetia bacterium]
MKICAGAVCYTKTERIKGVMALSLIALFGIPQKKYFGSVKNEKDVIAWVVGYCCCVIWVIGAW